MGIVGKSRFGLSLILEVVWVVVTVHQRLNFFPRVGSIVGIDFRSWRFNPRCKTGIDKAIHFVSVDEILHDNFRLRHGRLSRAMDLLGSIVKDFLRLGIFFT